MSLVEFLTNYFNEDDRLNKFNNSEITNMIYRNKVEKSFFKLGNIIWFPYDSSDMEIANVLKSIITVPFYISVLRVDNKIRCIEVNRVFIPNS